MAGKMLPVAVIGDMGDPATGDMGKVAPTPAGIGKLLSGPNATVTAQGKPIATVATAVTPHGNFTDPKLPGFNPKCATSLLSEVHCSPTVLICGKPAAVASPGQQGTMADCTHYAFSSSVPTVLIGGVV
jgi:uncharacterized Zn-binding protein involved in type VI secretion